MSDWILMPVMYRENKNVGARSSLLVGGRRTLWQAKECPWIPWNTRAQHVLTIVAAHVILGCPSSPASGLIRGCTTAEAHWTCTCSDHTRYSNAQQPEGDM